LSAEKVVERNRRIDDTMRTLTERETKALEAISRAGPTGLGPLAIGPAAIRGEHANIVFDIDAKRAMGREVAEALARNGHARAQAGRYVLS
jgi:hypothetical protein